MSDEPVTKEEVREAWWWEAEKNRSQRLDYLRKAVWSKGTVGGQYLPGVRLCMDKVYWYTKVFKETEDLSWVERRALSLKELLANVPVFVVDGSQIVGYGGARPNDMYHYVESGYMYNEDQFYDTSGLFPEEEKPWVRECMDYWEKRCFQTQAERYLSEEEQLSIKGAGTCVLGVSIDTSCSTVIDHSFSLETGLNHAIKMIDQKLDEAWELLTDGPGTPDTLHLHEKIDQWRAMKIAAEGVIDWANRYSRLARIIAENFESDPKRKAELLKISEICEKVPAEPAEHLQEAIQFERFNCIVARCIERVVGEGSYRIDELYWPYYKKDVIDEKTMMRQEAVELLAENNLRIYETTAPLPRVYRSAFQGSPVHLPTITIGGVDADGNDACNELTEAVLEACRLIRVGEPSYMFRYHPQASVSALRACYETVRQGLGYPSFQHDAVCIDTLTQNFGATLEEARCFANVVCMSPGVVKGRGGQGVRYACSAVLPHRTLEAALYDGMEPNISGAQVGPRTGDPVDLHTFDEFFEAWRKQVAHAYQMACRNRNKGRYLEARYLQMPYGSCLFPRCIESGIDVVDARSEPLGNPWIGVLDIAEVGDCMYAIKKLIYDDKKYTMGELVEALRSNWAGFSEMRQDFMNVPKFGNDNPEVDKLVAQCYKTCSEECGRNVEWGGAKYMTLPESASAWVALAPMVGALPNGKRQADCLYDGGVSPGAGFDKKGPTAVLRSVSKIDARKFKQILLNQRLSPSQLAGEKGFQLWMNYMKTWYDLNIPHVQFNMVDNETLRAAQREPEKYQELIVRVAGYSAHFVELNALTQEGIIERTVQEI